MLSKIGVSYFTVYEQNNEKIIILAATHADCPCCLQLIKQ